VVVFVQREGANRVAGRALSNNEHAEGGSYCPADCFEKLIVHCFMCLACLLRGELLLAII
jgi:hypothetical protein